METHRQPDKKKPVRNAIKTVGNRTVSETIFGMFHEEYSDSGIGKRIGVAYKPDDIDGVSNFIENTLRNMRNKVAHGESASLENTGEDVIVSATDIPLFPMLLLYPFL